MSADTELLREAAERMRERANAASEGPWETGGDGLVWPPRIGDPVSGSTDIEDAEHIASWDPGVALAVADWLDREARRAGPHAITTYEVREDWWAYSCHTCGVGGSTSNAGLAGWQDAHANVRLGADEAALAVARAFLGRAES